MDTRQQAHFLMRRANLEGMWSKIDNAHWEKFAGEVATRDEDEMFGKLSEMAAPHQFIHSVALISRLQAEYFEIGGQPVEIQMIGQILNTQAERFGKFGKQTFPMSEKQLRQVAKLARFVKVL